MNKGTANNRILKRSILKHIARTELTNTRVGADYSVLSEAASRFAIIVADGISELSPDLAFQRAVNNLAMSGASAEKMMISLEAGNGTSEQKLRDTMLRLTEISREENVTIIGGNTVFVGELAETDSEYLLIHITVYGNTLSERRKKLEQKVRPGDKIIIVGDSGCFGARLITAEKREELKERFAESYIRNIEGDSNYLNNQLRDMTSELIDAGAIYLHDVSFGGIYRTLVEMSEYTGLGVDILHERIPIRQDTIELCEFYNINPYQLLGTGSMAMAVPEERVDDVKSVLMSYENKLQNEIKSGKNQGLHFEMAGHFTEKKDRIVHSENYHLSRNLNYYDCDEIYKVLSRV